MGLIEFLGEGQHFGEWAGPGIQKNPLQLEQKMFFLFNTQRHPQEKFDAIGDLVPVLRNVPTLYNGVFSLDNVDAVLEDLFKLGSHVAEKRLGAHPEGIVVSAFGTKFKRTPEDKHKGEGKE